jgi:hypothetical protein
VYVAGRPSKESTITIVDRRVVAEVADALGPLPTSEVRCTEEMPPPWSFRFDFKSTWGHPASTRVSTSELPSTRAIYRTTACFEGSRVDSPRLEAAMRVNGLLP